MERRGGFVAGGTGYVGRALVARLLERGHEVRALVRAVEEPSENFRVLAVPEIRPSAR
ncbi:MAG: NAD-dependent epimerase/dehydratase family protein [Pyrinomonadaceae bacterium]